MTLDAFLETAWADHGDRPQEVADRLATSLELVATPRDFAPFVRLLTHVYGEHLGQWQAGIELLLSLQRLPAFDGSPAAAGPTARGVATLRYASGDHAALLALSVEDRVHALAVASSMFAARNETGPAIAAYTEALGSAEAGLPSGSPAIRALAIGGNNLAATLEALPQHAPVEAQAMLAAAEAGLKYWTQAGTWLEEERAEYRLARCLLKAGAPAAAITSARRCVDLCERNGAPPFELFFGYAVLALAHRAADDAPAYGACRETAMDCFARVSEDERKWCEKEVKELAG